MLNVPLVLQWDQERLSITLIAALPACHATRMVWQAQHADCDQLAKETALAYAARLVPDQLVKLG